MPSGIEYVEESWGPWNGCTRVSAGCRHCYMIREQVMRFHRNPYEVKRASQSSFQKPYTFSAGVMVFVCPWGDFFHPKADEWRGDAWAIIRDCSDVRFVILTKRVALIRDRLPSDWGSGYRNVMLVATCENQEMADDRLPVLLDLPAYRRGVSIAPMLGPVTIEKHLDADALHWVLVEGESGTADDVTPLCGAWVERVVLECFGVGIPVWFKQWGEWIPARYSGHIPVKRLRDAMASGLYCVERHSDGSTEILVRVGKYLSSNQMYLCTADSGVHCEKPRWPL